MGIRKIKKRLRLNVLHRLLNRGYYVSATAPYDRLLETIQLIKPKYTGHKLIRIGGETDGGYLIPDILDGIEYCFSPGVSVTADFEEMIATKYGIKSFLADFSVENPPMDNPAFEFDKKYLGATNDDVYIRLEEWVNQKLGTDYTNDLILQMDIEGSEFDVLVDTPVSILKKFRIIIIEFHDMDMMFDQKTLPIVAALFKKLTSIFTVAHIHPNNGCGFQTYRGLVIPNTFEMTLLRSDFACVSDAKLTLPHPLDRKNIPKKDDIILCQHWL